MIEAGGAIYPSLKGRSVFVTGGASGIGASVVRHFAAQGAAVAFVDIAVEPGHKLIQEVVADAHPAPLFIACDLRDIEALRVSILQAADAHGPITVLVNNAARDDRHRIQDVTPAYWDERMAVNLRHQFFAAQAVWPMMRTAGGGAIINMGSISWMIGQGGMPGYTTAKSAIAGLTRGLARDLGGDNIRVNTVAPGWIMTQRQLDLWLDAEGEAEILRRQCLKRKLYPADVARLVLFLAADDSAAITNQTYVCDGGWV